MWGEKWMVGSDWRKKSRDCDGQGKVVPKHDRPWFQIPPKQPMTNGGLHIGYLLYHFIDSLRYRNITPYIIFFLTSPRRKMDRAVMIGGKWRKAFKQTEHRSFDTVQQAR